MKKKVCSILGCVAVLAFMLLAVSIFSPKDSEDTGITDLMSDVESGPPIMDTALLDEYSDEYSDFALRLLQTSISADENTFLSPFSLLNSLAMTENGASGDTLLQMESAIGIPLPSLNSFMYTYTNKLYTENNVLSFANSLWMSEGQEFKANRDFLKCCADWYDADIYQTEFDDAALDAMNAWVSENTGGTVNELITQFRQPEGLILLSTVLFDAQWETPFSEGSNQEGIFTREDGTEDSATFMRSTEDLYFENDNCTGFLKLYRADGYAFAVLLPREGITVEELLNTTDGKALSALIVSASSTTVHISMPKFSAQDSTDMISSLMELGITDAFRGGIADLSGIGSGHLYITDIFQDTFITVDEIGTRAVAASAIAEFPASARETLEEKWVELDRPFVYMILDRNTGTPIFLGTVMIAE